MCEKNLVHWPGDLDFNPLAEHESSVAERVIEQIQALPAVAVMPDTPV